MVLQQCERKEGRKEGTVMEVDAEDIPSIEGGKESTTIPPRENHQRLTRQAHVSVHDMHCAAFWGYLIHWGLARCLELGLDHIELG